MRGIGAGKRRYGGIGRDKDEVSRVKNQKGKRCRREGREEGGEREGRERRRKGEEGKEEERRAHYGGVILKFKFFS